MQWVSEYLQLPWNNSLWKLTCDWSLLRLQPMVKEQHKLDVWSLVEGFANTQNQPIRTQQASYIREFSSFIRTKEGIIITYLPA